MFVTTELRAAVQKNLLKVDEYAFWLEDYETHLGESGIGQNTASNGGNAGGEDVLTGKLAAERALHVAIECTTDAANLVIDQLVMREPGGYADILRVLMEENVVTKNWFAKFEGALAFRDRLVHHYAELTADEVNQAVEAYAGLLPEYTAALRSYLDIV
ncbi:DUF86 domain-containing protein [Alicyclobacillus ferrooxydans]|uniref:DUF86 domain-containing protein n=1 Tax=Alicyclobacillus ferrooxydans TaxID=471514 RepID=UPI0006D579C3|nr:HepT-like ribonuclease domain-containing protein [Alicyclobacillus ferrooxydans]